MPMSRHKPLQVTKTMPPSARRSSTHGFPGPWGKQLQPRHVQDPQAMTLLRTSEWQQDWHQRGSFSAAVLKTDG
jgi:hypothetical protein